MSYQVLARKWRPTTFDQLSGQQHVLQGLIHSLDAQRLHHAYLFTGTRGVGKTTIARIIAKCLNCEAGVSSHPCGTCSACVAIDEGRFVDLIEIDAASRTKVEDTRELLDNVQYAPTQGRYKVYLIDEVHMLSMHSFNALLKTLEEPPEHVKFLLATTDPQKLPITVLSRCLQFHLRNIEPSVIAERLEYIAKQEGIEAEPQALQLLARAANGSLRDALSLLDQAISHGQGKVMVDMTANMLGTVNQQGLWQLVHAIAAKDAQALFTALADIEPYALDYHQVLAALSRVWSQVAAYQQLGKALSDEFDIDQLAPLAQQLPAEVVQVFYQISITSLRDLALAPDVRTGFEMALLRLLAFQPLQKPQAKPSPSKPAARQTPVAKVQAPVIAKPDRSLTDFSTWYDIVSVLPLNGVAKQAAMHCSLVRCEPSLVMLAADKQYAGLLGDTMQQRLEQTLQGVFGSTVRLQVEVGKHGQETPAVQKSREQQQAVDQAEETLTKDPHIQFMQAEFDAIIEPGSIKPVEEN